MYRTFHLTAQYTFTQVLNWFTVSVVSTAGTEACLPVMRCTGGRDSSQGPWYMVALLFMDGCWNLLLKDKTLEVLCRYEADVSPPCVFIFLSAGDGEKVGAGVFMVTNLREITSKETLSNNSRQYSRVSHCPIHIAYVTSKMGAVSFKTCTSIITKGICYGFVTMIARSFFFQ